MSKVCLFCIHLMIYDFLLFFFIDRPTPPRNIAVSNIKASSCNLTWDAPLDIGGSELTNYIVEMKDLNVEDPEKAEWVQVTNSIIEKRYGVSKTIIS